MHAAEPGPSAGAAATGSAPRAALPQREIDQVGHRLRQAAAATGLRHDVLVKQYAAERFLARVAADPAASRACILKGGFGLRAYAPDGLRRTTEDVDVLAVGTSDAAVIMRACAASPMTGDGVRFDPAGITQRSIQGQVAEGLRLKIPGMVGKTPVQVVVDVGRGDAVVPAPLQRTLPPTLDLGGPVAMSVYHPATMVAEKMHAALDRGELTRRPKDVYDVASLSRSVPFDGLALQAALEATFAQRQTPLPRGGALPEHFVAAAANPVQEQQWQSFLTHRLGAPGPSLANVTTDAWRLVAPVLESSAAGQRFQRQWDPRQERWLTAERG
jgi:predicted nucleotidyltransferase component of viral defense system